MTSTRRQFFKSLAALGTVVPVGCTPAGAAGVALCWELIRWRTAVRLRGKVDIVLAGSAYLQSEDFEKIEKGLPRASESILREAPRQLARLVGAPVVHANPVGKVAIGSFDDPQAGRVWEYMGQSQVVDAFGKPLAFRTQQEGEGVVVANVQIGRFPPAESLRKGFWIPKVPASYDDWFTQNRPKGSQIYRDKVRPHRNRR